MGADGILGAFWLTAAVTLAVCAVVPGEQVGWSEGFGAAVMAGIASHYLWRSERV